MATARPGNSLDSRFTMPADKRPFQPPAMFQETPTKPRQSPAQPENTPLRTHPNPEENEKTSSENLLKPIPANPAAPPGGWTSQRMSRKQEILFNMMIALLQIISQATLTTVFPITKIIATSFNITEPSILPWLVAAYALTFGTFILISGRLGDLLGHKIMVIAGFSIISFWSVVAGLSHYVFYELFFVARGFQGLGASMLVPNGLALLGRAYAPGTTGKVLSFTIFGVCAPIGAFLGFLFGAIFAQFAKWWWSCYTLAVVCALLAIMAKAILLAPFPTPAQMRPVRVKLKDMDWLGAVLGVSGLLLIQVALVSAPSRKWTTPWIYFVILIGFLLVAFFVITEMKIAEHPLVPFKILKADAAFVLAAVACGWATFGVWSWFLWLWLISIKHYSPLAAAIHIVPMMPASLMSSAATAILMRKTSPTYVLLLALAFFTVGCSLLAANTIHATYWTFTFLSIFITPWGMNMSFPASTILMSNMFPPHQQGIAGSLITTVINYSISFGLGLASTVEVHTNEEGRNVIAGIEAGYYFGAGVGGLGFVIALALVFRHVINKRRQEPRFSMQQARRLSQTMSSAPQKFSRASTLLHSRVDTSGDREAHGLLQGESRPTTDEGMGSANRRRGSCDSTASQEERYEYTNVTALPKISHKVWIIPERTSSRPRVDSPYPWLSGGRPLPAARLRLQ